MKRLTKQQILDKETKQLFSHTEANKTKDYLLNTGYKYSLSFYGVLFNPETTKHEYRRIEVFMDTKYDRIHIEAIYNFFNEIKPYFYYTIWLYNSETQNIVLIAGWD